MEFPQTLWTQIVRAQEGSEATRRDALDKLLRAYWGPVNAAIRYGWNRTEDEAKDLTQEFISELLERKFWESIDRSRGSFRSFVKAALKHFMLNDIRDRARQKRAHAEVPIGDYAKAEEALDREWIATVLRTAVDKLKAQFEKEGKTAYFEVLRRYDIEPDHPTYGSIAAALGLSESDVRNYLHQARARLREMVRSVVQEYADDLQEELRFILG
jgi:RNA polymerase sigma-70 factor (ECF subfamily)